MKSCYFLEMEIFEKLETSEPKLNFQTWTLWKLTENRNHVRTLGSRGRMLHGNGWEVVLILRFTPLLTNQIKNQLIFSMPFSTTTPTTT